MAKRGIGEGYTAIYSSYTHYRSIYSKTNSLTTYSIAVASYVGIELLNVRHSNGIYEYYIHHMHAGIITYIED